MKNRSRSRKRLYWSLGHGLFMIFLVFCWMRQPFIFKYEYNATENLLSFKDFKGMTENSLRNKYVNKFFFLNTSHSLITDEEASEDGKINVRADRKQLTELFQILQKHPDLYDIIFMDVFIPEIKSDEDTELIEVVAALQDQRKIITANIVVDDYIDRRKEVKSNNRQPRIFKQMKASFKYKKENVPNIFGSEFSAPMYYPISMNDAFYKYHHNLKIEGTYTKQAALKLYENLTNKSARNPFLWDVLYLYQDEYALYQNIDIPEMVLSSEDLFDIHSHENFQNTGNLDMWIDFDGEFLIDKLRSEPGKIIIIGDMALGDIHYSLAGRTEGPLIVANTLISLLEKNNRLSYLFLGYLWLSFSLVSYLTFYPEILENLKTKNFRLRLFNFFYHYLLDKANYLVLFIATLIGLYAFKHYIFLLFTLFYIYIVGLIIKEYKRNRV